MPHGPPPTITTRLTSAPNVLRLRVRLVAALYISVRIASSAGAITALSAVRSDARATCTSAGVPTSFALSDGSYSAAYLLTWEERGEQSAEGEAHKR